MRTSILVLCAGVVISLVETSTASAQAPAGQRRFSSPYGDPSGGMGGMGIGNVTGNLGTMGAQPRRMSSRPRQTSRPAAAPSRFSPSAGGAASGGGIGLSGGGGVPRRQLRRNSAPVVSPYLNLDPAFVGSEEGQYFARVLPQQEFNRQQRQTQQAISGLQGQIGEQETEIQTGLSTTGHKTAFMNLGSYFPQ